MSKKRIFYFNLESIVVCNRYVILFLHPKVQNKICMIKSLQFNFFIQEINHLIRVNHKESQD